jgi:hypothetical protein
MLLPLCSKFNPTARNDNINVLFGFSPDHAVSYEPADHKGRNMGFLSNLRDQLKDWMFQVYDFIFKRERSGFILGLFFCKSNESALNAIKK